MLVFPNGSHYDYHFIIKERAKEFKGEINCVEKHTEKYKIFSVLITKKLKGLIKIGNDFTDTVYW